MAGLAPEGTRFDARQYDAKVSELDRLSADGQEFFASYDEVYDTFDDMGLQENLLRGIYADGSERPSAIQQRGIVPSCKGLNVIQQALSGTGKTVISCSGILQQLDYGLVQCQALVLAPKKELAQQIEKVMRALGDYLGVKVHACVGGTSVPEDRRILKAGVHVVVGTPGRVFDMLRKKSLRSDHIKMFLLDEADEMFSRGFKDQIYDIFQLLPGKIQVGVFSATMPPEALDSTRKFMNKPEKIAEIEGQSEFSQVIRSKDSLGHALGNERPGRVRGLGFGPTPTPLSTQNSHSINAMQQEINRLQSELQTSNDRHDRLQSELQTLTEQQKKTNDALAFIFQNMMERIPPEFAHLINTQVHDANNAQLSPSRGHQSPTS